MKSGEVVPLPTADPRVYVLPEEPGPGAVLMLFRDGAFQHRGKDYELSGRYITYSEPLGEGEHHCVTCLA